MRPAAGLPDEKPMLGENELQDVEAEPASREGGDEDVGVEEDPHETSSKTSSSVTQPWASANGATRRRNCSSRAIAS